MKHSPEGHHRHSIRLRGYDYTEPGTYFVTIVTHDRLCIFDDPVPRRIAETDWRSLPTHFPHVVLDEWVLMPNHLHAVVIITGDANGWSEGRGEANPRRNEGTDRRGEAFANTRPIEEVPGSSPGSRHGDNDLANASPLPQPASASRLHSPSDRRSFAAPSHPLPPSAGSLGAIIASFKSASARRINRIRHTPGAPVWQRNYYEHIIRDQADLDRVRTYIASNPTGWSSDHENPAIPRKTK